MFINISDSSQNETKEKQAEILKDKGNTFLKNGHFSNAIELYTQSLSLHPTAVCYGNRSFVYLKLQKFKESLQDAESSVQHNEQYSKGYFRRAEAHMALENYDNAIADYEYSNKCQPKDEILLKIEECYHRMEAKALKEEGNENLKGGNLMEAVGLYTQSIDLYPTSNCYGNRSLAHYKLQNYEKSVADATESLRYDKNYSKGYLRRADAYVALLQMDHAIKDYKTYLTMNPNDMMTQMRLAALVETIGEVKNVTGRGEKVP